MVEKMTLEQVRDRLREAALYGLAGSVCQVLASHLNAHLTQPAQAVDDTRRLQFVLDHVPHSVLADFGVLPPMCDLPEGEAHIEDARATIDKALPNANGKEDTNAAH